MGLEGGVGSPADMSSGHSSDKRKNRWIIRDKVGWPVIMKSHKLVLQWSSYEDARWHGVANTLHRHISEELRPPRNSQHREGENSLLLKKHLLFLRNKVQLLRGTAVNRRKEMSNTRTKRSLVQFPSVGAKGWDVSTLPLLAFSLLGNTLALCIWGRIALTCV